MRAEDKHHRYSRRSPPKQQVACLTRARLDRRAINASDGVKGWGSTVSARVWVVRVQR